LNHALSKSYPCKLGGPILTQVDSRIFTHRYYQDCMGCSFCHDSCCQHGVDVDVENAQRLLAAPDKFKRLVAIPESEWFTAEVIADAEFPSGQHRRTQVRNGTCVFRNPQGRGCLIHAFCMDEGLDYHALKPMVSVLFPLTFEHGVLMPSTEILDGTLICAGAGPSCYDGVRGELEWYFGAALTRELDDLKNG
jgi:hypothetical protein